MKHHIIIKFLAVFLCAASLLGTAGSGLAIFAMSELGLNDRSLEEAYAQSVENTARSLANDLAVRYASRELGGADERLMNDYYGSHWLSSTFNWDKVGYTILDPEGNVVEEQVLAAATGTEAFFELTVEDSRYINVLNLMTQEEYDLRHAPVTEPVDSTTEPVSELAVYNAVPAKGCKISFIHVSYADGQIRDYEAVEGYLGALTYFTSNQLKFEVQSDYADVTMLFEDISRNTPVSMLFLDTSGALVLEISHPQHIIEEFSRTDGSSYFILRPLEDATQVPVGSVYDAIPPEGTAVSACSVAYANHYSESVGGTPDIGFLSYDEDGYVVFTSANTGLLDLQTETMTFISFRDTQGILVYSATDEDGVGTLSLEGDVLTFTNRTVSHIESTDPTPEDKVYIYDDVPPQGYPVYRIELWLEGSANGMVIEADKDALGFAGHDSNGNIRFLAEDWKDFVFSKPAEVVYIRMEDVEGRLLYEAKEKDVPTGSGCSIGIFAYDNSGSLVFGRSAEPAAAAETAEATPIGELPSETVPTVPAAQILDTVNVRFEPHEASEVIGMLEAGTTVPLLQITTLLGVEWGKTELGWILLDPETVTVTGVPEADMTFALTEETVPNVTEAEASEETAAPTEEVLPSETAPVMTGETPLVTAPVLSTEPTLAQDTEETEVTVPYEPEPAREDTHIYGYYDPSVGENMYAELSYEEMPPYTVQIHMAQGALQQQYGWVLMELVYALKDHMIILLVGSLLLFAITAVYLCCSAGRKPGTTEVRAGGLNCISLDLYLCAAIGGVALCFLGIAEGGDYLLRQDIQTGILFTALMAFAACLLVVAFCFAFAAQVKTPGAYWWYNSICGRSLKIIAWLWNKFVVLCAWLWDKYDEKIEPLLIRMCKALWKLIKFFWGVLKKGTAWLLGSLIRGCDWLSQKFVRFFSLLPLTWQFLLTGFVLVFLLYIMMRTYKVGYILLGFGIFFGVLLYAASSFGILLESAKRMSKGDLDEKVDDRLLIGGFRDFAGELNGLADVAVVAAQKQLKSERMKTELITNVSHDIKTPLTSIINYVDLMEKPHSPEEQQAYLEVLSRQSQRLKKLIDDLMEMSKASTGNMAVDIEKVNAAEAINQALGEFADKLDKAQLIPVFRQPETEIHMMADGRLVWRVLSNLLSNAVKYALPGTRLYIDLMELEGKVVLSLKNISRDSLNINADELLERFVRGDTARNTEGSGLGLNIAQSLMELQKGKLEILVDGDLFKVTLIFPGA